MEEHKAPDGFEFGKIGEAFMNLRHETIAANPKAQGEHETYYDMRIRNAMKAKDPLLHDGYMTPHRLGKAGMAELRRRGYFKE